MELEIRCHEPRHGWDRPLPAELDSERTLALVFGAPSLDGDSSPLRDLLEAFPAAAKIGCSTAGEILDAEIVDDSAVVAIARFESSDVRSASAEITAATSRATGSSIGAQLDHPGLRAVVVVSEGLDVNGSELVRGIVDATPEGTVITGGLAGDGDRFESTWILTDGGVSTKTVVAVGLYGPDLLVGYGSGGGWDRFGPERTITRSVDNVLFELDGRPALDLYKEYLGEQAKDLPASGLLFPLALRTADDTEELIVRTILGVDERERSLTFAGDVPTGSRAQLMTASFDRLVDGAERAALMAASEQSGPVLSIAISCVGRRLIMGERCEDEIEATLDGLPAGARQVGYYSYGEISPSGLQTCELHNQTMTITALGERAAA
jgi:hypothetical protein